MIRKHVANRIALSAALLLTSGFCNASGWTPALTVTSTFTENTDIIAIYTSDGGAYATNCAVNAWIFVADNEARRGRAYATIMTAIATGKKIQFWYSDSCAAWGYHQATAVMLMN